MGWLDRFRPAAVSESTEVRQLKRALTEGVAFLNERIAELELPLDEQGWQRIGGNDDMELSREGLDRIIRASNLAYIKNPLIRRAVNLRMYYTFGQGVEIAAKDDAVQEVVQQFLADNAQILFSHEARTRRDVDVQTDGNLLFGLFTDRLGTGRVRLASIPVHEVRLVVRNPDNRAEPWFYLRTWTEHRDDNPMSQDFTMRKALYPDWRYQPAGRRASINDIPIMWDTPVMHMAVGGKAGGLGIPDTYAALDWARAHTDFLESAATIFDVMARLLWKATGPGSKLESFRSVLESTLSTDSLESNPLPPPGAGIALPDGFDFQMVNKSGAGVDAEDARMFAMQVATAMDVTITALTGDVDQGNLATQTAMDRPTELAMTNRQELWTGWLNDLCDYAVDASAMAPGGLLRSYSRGVHRDADRLVVDLGDLDRTLSVDWPPLIEHSTTEMLDALVKVVTLDGKSWQSTLPFEEFARLVGTWLQIDDVDDFTQRAAGEFEAELERRSEQERQAMVQTASVVREAITDLLEAA